MGLEMDLLDGALFSQAQAKQDPNSLAAKIVGTGVPWAAEAKKRQPKYVATDTMKDATTKRRVKSDRAKQNDLSDEMISRFHKDGVKPYSADEVDDMLHYNQEPNDFSEYRMNHLLDTARKLSERNQLLRRQAAQRHPGLLD